MFDEKTRQELKYYVYMLLDPIDNRPFYVGKGNDNRVFNHLDCALTDLDATTAKYDKIREIIQNGNNVKHVIVRHGLTEAESFQIEASLIDSLTYCGIMLSNLVSGHNSIEKGLMTSEEVKRLYNAQPLNSIGEDCIIININRKYQRGKGRQSIYEATKETWTIKKSRLNQLKYVLSEYRGLIVEVFEVDENDFGKNMHRAILDIGLLDISTDFLIPDDDRIIIVGASSDMLVVDIGDSVRNYKVGDLVSFKLKYMGALGLLNSDYIEKRLV